MMRVSRILVIGLTAFAAETLAVDNKPSDRQLFQGTWRIILAEREGKPANDEVDRVRYLFSDGKLLIIDDDKTIVDATFELDAARKPKQLTIVAIVEGNAETVKGIYRFEKDHLTLCFAMPGEARPKAFFTGKGDGNSILIFERVPMRKAN